MAKTLRNWDGKILFNLRGEVVARCDNDVVELLDDRTKYRQ